MAKKQFKAESKRLLDLMINSIYTNKEIFLRELISNASDAEDKLAYKSLTDDSMGVSRADLKITIVPDKEKRTLTVSDNGIGMSREFQEHLFESLTREETSTVSGIQGTGLGMAINVSHMVQEIAMELLSNAGFSVSLADDGDVAVETLRTAAPDQFDLVLMDIQMPKLDGYSATRQIRTLDSAIAKVLG